MKIHPVPLTNERQLIHKHEQCISQKKFNSFVGGVRANTLSYRRRLNSLISSQLVGGTPDACSFLKRETRKDVRVSVCFLIMKSNRIGIRVSAVISKFTKKKASQFSSPCLSLISQANDENTFLNNLPNSHVFFVIC